MKLTDLPKINDVAFIKDEMAFVLNDGRIIYVPLKWSKKLNKATHKQRSNFKNNGVHIFLKNEVDEIINLQPNGNKAKAYQVKQVRNIIIKYKLIDHEF